MSITTDKLFDYQTNTFNKIKDLENGVLLSLDLGLGKTITAVAICEYWIQKQRVDKMIVVCQSIKLNDWKEDLSKMEIDGWEFVVIKTNKELTNFQKDKTIYIMSYSIFSNLPQHPNFNFVNQQTGFIYDECQTMKDWKTNISQAGLATSHKTNWKIMISGDPISNSYKDLFVLLKILGFYFDGWDNLEMEKIYFDNHFMTWKEMKVSKTKTILKPVSNKNENELLELLHQKGVFIKTKEVLELPEQIFEDIYFDIPKECHLILKEMKQRFLMNQSNPFEEKTLPINFDKTFDVKFLTELFKHNYTLASGFLKKEDNIQNYHYLKVNLLEKIFEKHLHKNIVIFYNFNHELETIKNYFQDKFTIVEINGKSHLEQALPKIKENDTLILVQYKAGATGINLQAYSNIIVYYTLTTSGELYKQSSKRIHRIGQTKDCYYYHLIGRKTVDEKIFETIKNSQKLTDAMFLGWIREL